MINYDKIQNIEDLEEECSRLEERLSLLLCEKDNIDDALKMEIMEDYQELKSILNPYIDTYGIQNVLKKANSEWINIIREKMNQENNRNYEIKIFDRDFLVTCDSYLKTKKKITRHCIAIVADDYDISEVKNEDLVDFENSLQYFKDSDYVFYGIYSVDTDKYLNRSSHFRIRPGMSASLIEKIMNDNFKENKEKIKEISLQKRI